MTSVNKNINGYPSPDFLYHIGLHTGMDLPAMFGDVRCALLMGSSDRAHAIGSQLAQEFNEVLLLVGKSKRYALYKIGRVLCVSHGIGMASLSILMHELVKLFEYSKCPHTVPMIRIGTSGGIGVPAGSVVLTTGALNGMLEESFDLPILGKMVSRSTAGFCSDLIEKLYECRGDIPVVKGKTMSCDCFYEGQGRLDGAICKYTEAEKMEFLEKVHAKGVMNIEMESAYLGMFGLEVGYPVACVCCTLLDRLNGDQVSTPGSELNAWAMRSASVCIAFIKKYIY